MSRVILFDIDNTLLYTGGAGTYAMNAAFEELYGVAEGFAHIEFSGRTDHWIVQSALEASGIKGATEQHLEEFCKRYYALLPDSLAHHDGHLMPGFPELLAALSDAGAVLGLTTGNFSTGAMIKLRYYGIDAYFKGGGFGENLDRGALVATAIRDVAGGAPSSDILVIGDTPHDITSALANGVVPVGVATGNFTTTQLSAAGADAVYRDFADWQASAESLLSLAPPA